MQPVVTILVPCYNYGAFIAQALDSLLGQTLHELELIVIDDASSDDTPSVLARYADEPRIRIIRHTQNQGHLRSYNEGLALARGRYVGIVSADDYCLRSDAVACQVALFEQNPSVGMVYSAHIMLDPDGRTTPVVPRAEAKVVPGLDEFRRLVWGNYILHSGTLLRRDVQETLGPYDLDLPQSGDWDFWLRASAGWDVGYVAEPLYVYRLHHSNMQSKGIAPAQQADQNAHTLEKAFAALPVNAPADLWQVRKRSLDHALLQTAWFDLYNGRASRAWQGLIYGCRRRPALALNPELWRFCLRLAALVALGHARYRKAIECLDRIRSLNEVSTRAQSV
jgi:glycosyltransferase involved in cell wall biosynthesis